MREKRIEVRCRRRSADHPPKFETYAYIPI
jgi:hypothetical protein